MSSVIKMVLWLLIAITATSVVFPENAVVLLAIALIGVLLVLSLFVKVLFLADEMNAVLHATSVVNARFLFQQIQELRQQAGLPPLDTGLSSLESLLDALKKEAGHTQKSTTDF